MPLEAADKTIIYSAGQTSLNWQMLISQLVIHFWVYIEESGGLTLGAYESTWPKSGVQKLRLDCHYECTMWILNQF